MKATLKTRTSKQVGTKSARRTRGDGCSPLDVRNRTASAGIAITAGLDVGLAGIDEVRCDLAATANGGKNGINFDSTPATSRDDSDPITTTPKNKPDPIATTRRSKPDPITIAHRSKSDSIATTSTTIHESKSDSIAAIHQQSQHQQQSQLKQRSQYQCKDEHQSQYQYDKAYVEKNLIAYIGNKRRLLPLIVKALEEVRCIGENGGAKLVRSGVFIDYFSGTGVVARLAKSLGFRVIANDWEPYAHVLARGFLETSSETLTSFANEGGLKKVLNKFNKLRRYNKKQSYIAKYYCPRNTKKADPHLERLFYTRENGILIDNIRSAIDAAYPETDHSSRMTQQKRQLLLALLLVQASKRSNTSGIFKAYHHGFGGRNQDALSRILTTIALEVPVLTEKATPVHIFKSDALRLARKLSRTKLQAEVVYLDPPYNQHQYGSNYHLLNTIALGDQPTIDQKFWHKGKKIRKAAIREDWTQTRSSFCYRKSALQEFKNLTEQIKAKYILVSYSTEGIIDFNAMLEVLAKKGKVSVVTQNYVRFRGGRQTNVTKKLNVEFVLIVETGAQTTPADIAHVKMKVGHADFINCFNDFFPIHQQSKRYKVIAHGFGYELFFIKERKRLFLDKKLRLCREKDFSLPTTQHQKELLAIHSTCSAENISPSKKIMNASSSKTIIDEQSLRNGVLDHKDLPASIISTILQVMPKTNEERIAGIACLLEQNYEIDKPYFLGELLRLYRKLLGDTNHRTALTRSRHRIQRALQSILKSETSVVLKSGQSISNSKEAILKSKESILKSKQPVLKSETSVVLKSGQSISNSKEAILKSKESILKSKQPVLQSGQSILKPAEKEILTIENINARPSIDLAQTYAQSISATHKPSPNSISMHRKTHEKISELSLILAKSA